ncbi:hypothetical protein H9P43_010163 [Blastocladiella emersonii ATCC 22665]|nr:hypothetical protein H9P43_010163 [Blastocladiella emersonii ATCC 22665]
MSGPRTAPAPAPAPAGPSTPSAPSVSASASAAGAPPAVDSRGKSLHRRSSQIKRDEFWSANALLTASIAAAAASSASASSSSPSSSAAPATTATSTSTASSTATMASGPPSAAASAPVSPAMGSPASPSDSAPQSAADFEASARALVEKILDLNTIRLEAKMAEFFATPGVLPIFLSYIARIPTGELPHHSAADWTIDRALAALDARDRRLEPTILSYRAMDILCATNPVNASFVDRHLGPIVDGLFDVLATNSHGNLYHFAQVLDSFLRRNPTLPVIDLLLSPSPPRSASPADAAAASDSDTDGDAARPLFPLYFRLLRHLHHPAIPPLALSILTVTKVGHPNRAERFARLQEAQFIEFLVTNIEAELPDLVAATVDLFGPLVDEVLRMDGCSVLFMSLATDHALLRRFVSLVKCGKDYQRNAVFAILHALVVRSVPKPLTSTAPAPMSEAALATSIAHVMSLALTPHLPVLAAAVSDLTVASVQLKALELVQHLVFKASDAAVQTIESALTALFWRNLTDLVLLHHPTSPFLAVYFRLLRTVLVVGSDTLLRWAIAKPKLIQRLIGYYESGDASAPVDPVSIPGMSRKRSMQLAKLLQIPAPVPEAAPSAAAPAIVSAPTPAEAFANAANANANGFFGAGANGATDGLANGEFIPVRAAATDLHAFAILVLNLIRLTADAVGPEHYLGRLLMAMPRYQSFLATLHQQTRVQVTQTLRDFPTSHRMARWPAPQVMPDQVRVEFVEKSMFAQPGTVPLTSDQELGIELGSRYAVCLGFHPSLVPPAVPIVTIKEPVTATQAAAATTPDSEPGSPWPYLDDPNAPLSPVTLGDGSGSIKRRRRRTRRKSRAELFEELRSTGIIIKADGATIGPMSPGLPSPSPSAFGFGMDNVTEAPSEDARGRGRAGPAAPSPLSVAPPVVASALPTSPTTPTTSETPMDVVVESPVAPAPAAPVDRRRIFMDGTATPAPPKQPEPPAPKPHAVAAKWTPAASQGGTNGIANGGQQMGDREVNIDDDE